MRRLVGLGFVLGGIGLACLLVGMGSGSDCATGMGSAACLGGSLPGARSWIGFAGLALAITVGVVAVAIVVEARRHRRLAAVLHSLARSEWLADQPVGLVPGLEAPYVAGLGSPRIYCPANLEALLSESELRAVLLHERYHQVSHAPARLVVLASIANIVGWVPAGVRWLEARRAAIEIQADDYALTAGARRSDLARALLKLGASSFNSRLPSYASASELRLRHLTGDEAALDDGRLRALAPIAAPIAAFAACLVLGLAS
jgi:beta-lactamase regulating signal transducer with metallopeptidase domain